MQKFKLEAEFISKDNQNAEGYLKVNTEGSTPFIAGCLYQIIDEIEKENRLAVDVALTKYMKERVKR